MSKFTRREYLDGMRAKTKDGIQRINKILDKVDEFNENRKNYSPEYCYEMNIKLQNELNDARVEVAKTINSYAELYTWQIEESYGLNPKDITPDVELLKTGVALNERDIDVLLHRSEDNLTMRTLITRYARDNKIGRYKDSAVPIAYGLQEEKRYCSDVAECSHMALKWSRKNNVYEELLGESSNASAMAEV